MWSMMFTIFEMVFHPRDAKCERKPSKQSSAMSNIDLWLAAMHYGTMSHRCILRASTAIVRHQEKAMTEQQGITITDLQKDALVRLCKFSKPVRLKMLADKKPFWLNCPSTGTMDLLVKKGLARSVEKKGIRHWIATENGKRIASK